jgi:hypothetical protein
MGENRNFKLSMLFVIFTFSAIVLTLPTTDARGTGHHAGGNQAGSGSHSGHRGHISGHRRNHSGHRHFGGSQRHFGGSHKHFGGHRSHYGGVGRHRPGYRQNYNYYPRSYGYSYTPRYSSRSYSSYSPRYYSPRSYSTYTPSYSPPASYTSLKTYPPNYSSNINIYNGYNSNSADTRYIEKDMESKVTDNAGWQLLAQNRASEALSFFAGQAGLYQNDGVPKVGYALSTAMQGDLDRAAWAMRRAFRIDPSSLHYIYIEQSLRISINNLIAEYNSRLNYSDGYGHSDPAFMIAALYYLLHDENAARKAIEEAIDKAGDNSQSAQNLYNLVMSAD